MAAGCACCCGASIVENERKRSFSTIVPPPCALSEGSCLLSPGVSRTRDSRSYPPWWRAMTRDRPAISHGTRSPAEECSHSSAGDRGPGLRVLPQPSLGTRTDRVWLSLRLCAFASLRLCVFLVLRRLTLGHGHGYGHGVEPESAVGFGIQSRPPWSTWNCGWSGTARRRDR
jgi:hypothetical protein